MARTFKATVFVVSQDEECPWSLNAFRKHMGFEQVSSHFGHFTRFQPCYSPLFRPSQMDTVAGDPRPQVTSLVSDEVSEQTRDEPNSFA